MNIAKILVGISFCSIIIVNALSFMIPIKGGNVAQIASWYPNYFTPSQYTFIIWIIIYFLLGAFAVYQYKIPQSSLVRKETVSLIRNIFMAYCIFNFVWMLSWLFDYLALSTMTIIAVSVCIGYLCRLLSSIELSAKDRLFIKLPFSILYGWLCITSAMNLVILLESVRFKGFGLPLSTWAVFTFLCVAVFALIQTYINKDIAFCLTVIWSYIGILVKHINNGELDRLYPYAVPVLIICILLLTGSAVYLAFLKKPIHKYFH
jgi:hypothetical protein